jgi:hypothetical protein
MHDALASDEFVFDKNDELNGASMWKFERDK